MLREEIRLFFVSVLLLSVCASGAAAQDAGRLEALTAQIAAASSAESAYQAFEELTDMYFKERRYNEYLDFLNSLAQKKKEFEPAIDYYIALSRYYQLAYLEETQAWDEYFGKGNDYRGQIKDHLDKAILPASQSAPDVYGLYARLLFWKFQKNQEGGAGAADLNELMDYISLYAAKPGANLAAIKEAATELRSGDEKAKARRVYKIYTDKLLASGTAVDKLKDIALGFYREADLELAESIYDAYLDSLAKTAPREKLIPELVGIAQLFAYGKEKPFDAQYAEKIFAKIDEITGKQGFDQGLMYLRAFNLEKAKLYALSRRVYEDFYTTFADSPRSDEAVFKSGYLTAYGLGKPKEAKVYFERLAAGKSANPHTVASLYQLGLISQWENNQALAKKYYDQILEILKDTPSLDTAALAKTRLKEIEETRPIEHGLKVFLDAAFTNNPAPAETAPAALSSESYNLKKNESVFVSSACAPQDSGCVSLDLEYFWSGHLGKTTPQKNEPAFDTGYDSSGPKEVNLLVVSPAGIVAYDFSIIEVE